MQRKNKMRKALIHIGASGLQLETLLWAKESGLHVIATDRNSNAEGKDVADEFYNISGTDEDSLLELAQTVSKNFTLVGVYCNSDFSLAAAAKINKKYGLRGCLPETVQTSIDKTKAKELMSNNNVPIPRGVAVDGALLNMNEMSHLQFPLIVKPIDSCGSQGVRYVNDLHEMMDGINGALTFSKKILIEEFILGDGIDTIGIMKNGKLYPCGLGLRFFSDLPFRFPTHGYANTTLSRLDKEEAYRITEEAAIAVGISDGPVKADLIFYEGKFTVIEVTPRFHGDVFTNKMIVYATGFNPAKELFGFLTTGKISNKSILDIEPAFVLWKGLFPLVDNIDWPALESDFVNGGRVLDFYLDPRFTFTNSNHTDNTSLSGFIWLEFDNNESMNQYLEGFKSKYNGTLL